MADYQVRGNRGNLFISIHKEMTFIVGIHMTKCCLQGSCHTFFLKNILGSDTKRTNETAHNHFWFSIFSMWELPGSMR